MDYRYSLSALHDGTLQDLTELTRSVRWSGDYKTVSRQLGFSLLRTEGDLHQPQWSCGIGDGAAFAIDGEPVFDGLILDADSDSLGTDADRVAYDWGLYLKRNSTSLKVANQTPEEVVEQLAAELGFELGSVAKTGVRLSRNFLPANYYEIIRTLYDLAGAQTGKQYHVRFWGRALQVVAAEQTSESLLLEPGSNLLYCRQRDSAANLVNRVRIYDDDGKLTETAEDASSIALYGAFQGAILASSYKDPAAQAAKLLREGELATTLICECTGSPLLVTGGTVVVHEPRTDSYGLFYVAADVHTWAKGIYKTQIQISLRDLVSETEAANAAKAAETAAKKKKKTS